MDVTIAVIIHNSRSFITNLLNNLSEVNCNQYFLLNGLIDANTIKLFEDYKKTRSGIKILKTESMLRHPIAINMLLSEVKTKYVFIMDSDILTTEDDLLRIYNLMSNDKTYGAVQGLLLYPQSNTVQSSGHLFYEHWDHYGHLNSINYNIKTIRNRQALSAGFAMYPMDMVRSMNGFDEFYQHQMDGVEFSTRILKSGYKVCCLPTAQGYHFHSLLRKTISNKPKNEIGKYWMTYGNDIKDDLIEEIIDNPLYQSFSGYNIIDCSSIKNISFFLNRLKLKNRIMLKVTDLIDPEIILHNSIPNSILNSRKKLLWICTNYTQIVHNKIAFSNVHRKDDFILDMSANIIPVKLII